MNSLALIEWMCLFGMKKKKPLKSWPDGTVRGHAVLYPEMCPFFLDPQDTSLGTDSVTGVACSVFTE